MNWRALLYLVLVGPLHHLAMILATLPAMLLFPPDILIQLVFSLPVFCVVLYWAVPALMQRFGLMTPSQNNLGFKITIVGAALLFVACAFGGVIMGYVTPAEATVLNLAALICLHIWLIRSHLRR